MRPFFLGPRQMTASSGSGSMKPMDITPRLPSTYTGDQPAALWWISSPSRPSILGMEGPQMSMSSSPTCGACRHGGRGCVGGWATILYAWWLGHWQVLVRPPGIWAVCWLRCSSGATQLGMVLHSWAGAWCTMAAWPHQPGRGVSGRYPGQLVLCGTVPHLQRLCTGARHVGRAHAPSGTTCSDPPLCPVLPTQRPAVTRRCSCPLLPFLRAPGSCA
jgi:hypothetical protein